MRKRNGSRSLILVAFILYLAFIPGAAFGQLVGWWRGIIEQPLAGGLVERYIAEMTLYGNKGKIDYPEYKCGGELIFEKTAQDAHFYRERIRYGQGTCVDGGLLMITESDEGTLRMSWKKDDITAAGFFFGPAELSELEALLLAADGGLDAPIGKYAATDIAELLAYEPNIRDGRTPTLVAFTYARSRLEIRDRALLVMLDGPDAASKNIQATASSLELTESIRFAGTLERLQFISVIINLSDAALQDKTRRHKEWEAVLLYAETALSAAAPSSVKEGLQWTRSNLDKSQAKTILKGIEISWKMAPPSQELKKLRPDLKFQAVLLFTVKEK